MGMTAMLVMLPGLPEQSFVPSAAKGSTESLVTISLTAFAEMLGIVKIWEPWYKG